MNPINNHQKQSFLNGLTKLHFSSVGKSTTGYGEKMSPQQSTLTSTMAGSAQKTHWPSWGQAIHLPNHAAILIKTCWSGIAKKQKEKISFSIKKSLTSWRNRIKAKKHIENLLFLTKRPSQRPQSTAYAFICFCWWKRKRMAKKELFLIELVTFFFEKWLQEKSQKMTIKLTYGLQISPQSLPNMRETFLNLW